MAGLVRCYTSAQSSVEYRSFHMFVQSPQRLLLSPWEQLLCESCGVVAELLQRRDPVFLLVLF